MANKRSNVRYGAPVFDIVLAADLDWGIGKTGGIPWPKLRRDLQHFKRVTTTASPGARNAVVMGRKTWDSQEVAHRPLPGRLNVIVSRSPLDVPEGVIAATTLDAALAVTGVESIFVVGGAGLLLEALPRPDLRYIYLTRVAGHFDCDVQIPDLDARGFLPDPWDGAFSAEDGGVSYRTERLRREA